MNKCKEIKCSLCCGNIPIQMTYEQAQAMQKAGTILEDKTNPLSERELLSFYMHGYCAYLVRGECSVYQTEKQPESCRRYEFNGDKCRTRKGE